MSKATIPEQLRGDTVGKATRINIILISGLLAGALIAGIGSGIAFAEYMSFEYEAITPSTQEDRGSETFNIPLAETDRIYLRASGDSEIVLDEDVPVSSLVIDASFDASIIEPYYFVESESKYFKNEANGELYSYDTALKMGLIAPDDPQGVESVFTQKNIIVGGSWISNSPDRFMENKDVVLEGLKNGVIIEYLYDSNVDATVRINPACIDRVEVSSLRHPA